MMKNNEGKPMKKKDMKTLGRVNREINSLRGEIADIRDAMVMRFQRENARVRRQEASVRSFIFGLLVALAVVAWLLWGWS